MNFALRTTESELMDAPNIPIDTLENVFEDINRANKLLGGDDATVNEVLNIIKSSKKESYTILDAGCGDGHMLRELARALRKQHISAKLVGIELRNDVAQIAKSKSKDFPEISFQQGDIFKLNSKEQRYDFVLCTLTVHHFKCQEIPALLEKLISISKEAVIINDLQRTHLGYQLFKVFGFFFLKTRVAKHDGLVSIKRGFKKQELLDFAKKIPNVIHDISWRWAFRYIWILKPERPT